MIFAIQSEYPYCVYKFFIHFKKKVIAWNEIIIKYEGDKGDINEESKKKGKKVEEKF